MRTRNCAARLERLDGHARRCGCCAARSSTSRCSATIPLGRSRTAGVYAEVVVRARLAELSRASAGAEAAPILASPARRRAGPCRYRPRQAVGPLPARQQPRRSGRAARRRAWDAPMGLEGPAPDQADPAGGGAPIAQPRTSYRGADSFVREFAAIAAAAHAPHSRQGRQQPGRRFPANIFQYNRLMTELGVLQTQYAEPPALPGRRPALEATSADLNMQLVQPAYLQTGRLASIRWPAALLRAGACCWRSPPSSTRLRPPPGHPAGAAVSRTPERAHRSNGCLRRSRAGELLSMSAVCTFTRTGLHADAALPRSLPTPMATATTPPGGPITATCIRHLGLDLPALRLRRRAHLSQTRRCYDADAGYRPRLRLGVLGFDDRLRDRRRASLIAFARLPPAGPEHTPGRARWRSPSGCR